MDCLHCQMYGYHMPTITLTLAKCECTFWGVNTVKKSLVMLANSIIQCSLVSSFLHIIAHPWYSIISLYLQLFKKSSTNIELKNYVLTFLKNHSLWLVECSCMRFLNWCIRTVEHSGSPASLPSNTTSMEQSHGPEGGTKK